MTEYEIARTSEEEARVYTMVKSLRNPQYRLIKPISVRIEWADPGFLVYDEEDFTYGTGDSIDEALEDYRGSLIAEFEVLCRDRAILAEVLQRELRILETYVERNCCDTRRNLL